MGQASASARHGNCLSCLSFDLPVGLRYVYTHTYLFRSLPYTKFCNPLGKYSFAAASPLMQALML